MEAIKKQEHTPGPWHVADGTRIVSSDGWTLGDADSASKYLNDQEANARLIAAAPELLEAAEHFFEWHAANFEDFEDETNMQLLCLANEFEAAIHKARGE